MPYSCTLVGSSWHLHKKGSSDVLGSHKTKKDCNQQMRAIYASELSKPENLIIDGIIAEYNIWDIDSKISSAKDSIDVVINSEGGDLLTALSVHQKLRNSGKKVNVHINPIAASAGAVIALAGDYIYIPENGLVMFHRPAIVPNGAKDSEELTKMVNTLKAMEEVLINTMVSRTKKSKEECEELMNKATWLTAEEAFEMGIVDEVVPIYRDVKVRNYFPERIVNFLKEKDDMPLKEICDQFGAKDEADLVKLINDLKANQKPAAVNTPESILNMLKKAREIEINSLVSTGKIAPVVATELKNHYCNDNTIKNEFSSGIENGEFERVINSHSKNEKIISFNGSSGQQTGGTNDKNKTSEEDDDVCARLMAESKV